MIALVDTNVILDVWLRREPFVSDSASVLNQADKGAFEAYVCATTVPTLYFLGGQHEERTAIRESIRELLEFCEVAAVNKSVLQSAATSPIPDFEDAVIAESARAANIDTIVSRDVKGFRKSGLLAYTPSDYLTKLQTLGNGS